MGKLNLSGVSTSTIVRGVMTIVAAANVILGYLGVHVVTVTSEEIGLVIDGLIVAATAGIWAWGWWKNNSFTLEAQKADKVMAALKEEYSDV